MGEATYYAKIYFESEEKAKEALPKVRKFFLEGVDADDFWQGHRDMKNKKEFWKTFDDKFPEVSNYLRATTEHDYETKKSAILFGGDHNNRLAGYLNFGEKSELEDDKYCPLEVDGSEIRYHATVWYFANWRPMLDFVKKRYGAIKTGYVSDEYVDYFDCIKEEE
jgi:hypothetical protein